MPDLKSVLRAARQAATHFLAALTQRSARLAFGESRFTLGWAPAAFQADADRDALAHVDLVRMECTTER